MIIVQWENGKIHVLNHEASEDKATTLCGRSIEKRQWWKMGSAGYMEVNRMGNICGRCLRSVEKRG